MIGRLTGRIVEEGDQGQLVIDVEGVGYEVFAPYGTTSRAKKSEDGRVTLSIHTLTREDALLLYGFASTLERDTFRIVIGVANVGPKLGLALLSALEVPALAEVVTRSEVARLVAIPGIGKKTAERLVLELKGKLGGKTFPVGTGAGLGAGAPARDRGAQLQSALMGLGFRGNDVDRVMTELAPSINEEAELGDLLREALSRLTS